MRTLRRRNSRKSYRKKSSRKSYRKSSRKSYRKSSRKSYRKKSSRKSYRKKSSRKSYRRKTYRKKSSRKSYRRNNSRKTYRRKTYRKKSYRRKTYRKKMTGGGRETAALISKIVSAEVAVVNEFLKSQDQTMSNLDPIMNDANHKKTPLGAAAIKGDADIVRLLVNYKSSPDNIQYLLNTFFC